MRSNLWKKWEREVASWIGSRRNPLSGSNNVSDDGKERLGDVICDTAVIEVKLRANNSVITRARESYEKVKGKLDGRRFIYIERAKGKKDLVCLVLPYEDAKEVVRYLTKIF